jgi:hypothetical protein
MVRIMSDEVIIILALTALVGWVAWLCLRDGERSGSAEAHRPNDPKPGPQGERKP